MKASKWLVLANRGSMLRQLLLVAVVNGFEFYFEAFFTEMSQ